MTSPFAYEWLYARAKQRPDAPCIGGPSGWTSYGVLAERTQKLAGSLLAAGVEPGEVVLSSLPDGPANIAFTLAAQSVGACVAELNKELSPAALTAIATETRARFAAVAARDAAALAKLGVERLWLQHSSEPNERLKAAIGSASFVWLREDGSVADDAAPHAGGVDGSERTALLVYTSGSTGVPRAVMQTHKNLDANTRAIAQYLELSSADRACLVLPLFYCYGKSVLLSHLFVGGSVYFDNRFMYPRVVLEAIGTEGCTGFAGVPLTFELLKRQVDVRSISMPSLRYITQAGGAMHPDTIDWTRQAFDPAQLYVMYGQTEATARLSYLPPARAADKRGSVGGGIPGVTLKVVDDQGHDVAPGTIGNVIASGDSITPGYFQAPAESQEVLKNGWLWTGDLGYLDADGFLFLTGRAKEILKLSGHRVSAKEIEEVIASHPSVQEVAVAGAPDAVAGEAAVAFVVTKSEATLEGDDVRRHVRERLAAYKVPRDVVFVAALPRTANGKVARADLLKLIG